MAEGEEEPTPLPLERESDGEEQAAPDDAAGPQRAWCSRCDRAERVCVCASLPAGMPFDTDTRIVVLVHPKEVKRKCGTLPLLRAGLQNLQVIEGTSFPEPEDAAELHEELTAGGTRRVALVCPGPGAVSLEEFRLQGASASGAPQPAALVLVDGTWAQAKAMVRKSRWLQEIPRVVISASAPSGYTFRQQPKDGCLSTLEAAAEALAVLERDAGHGATVQAGLREAFRAMVDNQTQFIPSDESVDKNAPGGREAFREAKLEATARKVGDRDLLPPVFICRWGEWIDRGAGRKRMHVERILRRVTMPEANEICFQLSASRIRGQKLFVSKCENIPSDVVYECPDSERLDTAAAPIDGGASPSLVAACA
eukprot:TRINITY_DN37637_c0_g1_i1.p1 TRINITY_DN37637_c0_g1~~TRINITY_DN37637_c0_g1_i1.p1  ORF type:complete len:397 (+),score=92.87 TRINITY_DN37637_c0_g1_i1:89-1192(+)